MKKILALVLTAVMLMVTFAGCGANGKTLAEVKEASKLVIATSPDFPPFEGLGADGNTVEGIEIDLLGMICDELGVELVIETMDFDAVLAGIAAGKYDVGVSGITVTEKRKKNMLFTDPYCMAAQAIVVTENSAIASKADLTGKKISVQTGTTAESFCMENEYAVEAYAANNDAEMALVQGKVDAWVIDDLTAAAMVAEYNSEHEDKLVVLPEPMTTEPYALAFAFGSEDLVAEVNKIIAKIIDDGTMPTIFEKFDAPYTPAK